MKNESKRQAQNVDKNDKKLLLSGVICSVCGSDKIIYETIIMKSVKIQLIDGKTIATPVYQDMEYKVCCNCEHKWTGWDDEKHCIYL